jgi:hypothetical protein
MIQPSGKRKIGLIRISHHESPDPVGAAQGSPARKCWESAGPTGEPRRGDTYYSRRALDSFFRPYRGLVPRGPHSQGCALGYILSAPPALHVVRIVG